MVEESVTILDQSGKVVKTGKEILSIFKDARDIYKERRQSLRQDLGNQHPKLEGKPPQKLLGNVKEGDALSVASSGRPHPSRTLSRPSRASEMRERAAGVRAPLTAEALSQIAEGVPSDAGSTASPSRISRGKGGPAQSNLHRRHTELSSCHTDELERPELYRRHTGMDTSEVTSLPPYRSSRPSLGRATSVLESIIGAASPRPSALSRRNTEQSVVSRRHPNPPSYSSLSSNGLLNRSNTIPDFHNENIDMNLAYGKMPGPNKEWKHSPQELELRNKVSKIDNLLLEAHCLQGTATAIISKLQTNPEAMAAVALTLAQISYMLKNYGPALTKGLKLSSPATFALLSSPQFMIAGGVAAGITVVAFGGYKIIKKMTEQKALENKPVEALNYEGTLSSIDSWRRGVSVAGSDVDDDASSVMSVGTSVEGEIITPEANKRREERKRARSEARSAKSELEGQGMSSRSLVPRGRSDSYRRQKEKDRAGDGDDSRLGKELVARPKAGRASRSRSALSVKPPQRERGDSKESDIAGKDTAREENTDRPRGEYDGSNTDDENQGLVMYKSKTERKELQPGDTKRSPSTASTVKEKDEKVVKRTKRTARKKNVDSRHYEHDARGNSDDEKSVK